MPPGAKNTLLTRLLHDFPTDELPLSGEADEQWQHGVTMTTADMLGNACITGGAKIAMRSAHTASKPNNTFTPLSRLTTHTLPALSPRAQALQLVVPCRSDRVREARQARRVRGYRSQ